MASTDAAAVMSSDPNVEVINTSYHIVKREVVFRPTLTLEYDFHMDKYIYVYSVCYLMACPFTSVLCPFDEGGYLFLLLHVLPSERDSAQTII